MKEQLAEKIHSLKNEALTFFDQAQSEEDLYQTKVRYLGKKGELTEILKNLGQLPPSDRPILGALANQLRSDLEEAYQKRTGQIKEAKIRKNLEADRIDLTLPGFQLPHGSLHPVGTVLSDMKDIFKRMGFDIFEGPEIEDDYYNFEALNIPPDHPARDMQDTFYLGGPNGTKLLRTHTSPVQIRVMEKEKPPIQMVAPGVVYRRDSDVSHTPMFHQIEGLLVDRGISLAHLKGVIEVFLRAIFSPQIKVRFRPSYFPFTEPSAEVDIECVFCKPSPSCRICKGSGWLEVMGCGMVHPAVFEKVGINPKLFTGFAFGIGIERVAMLKYGINDIRLFFENDLRFLEQFS